MKLLQVYNSAPHYRESIFRLVDSTFDCDYIFGMNMGDIKQMDTSFLNGIVTKINRCIYKLLIVIGFFYSMVCATAFNYRRVAE